jgi:hypothetical protein
MKTSPPRHSRLVVCCAATIAAAALLPAPAHAQNFGQQLGNTNNGTNNSVIVSGQNNRLLSSPWAIIGSGSGNVITNGGHYSVIGGGLNNFDAGSSNSKLGFIGGGFQNTLGVGARMSFVGGGFGNTVSSNSLYGFIGGGAENTIGGAGAAPLYAAVVAGNKNTNLAGYSLIFGGGGNTISIGAIGSFIGSGQFNTVSSNAQNAAVLSGYSNVAGANYALVMGGYFNEARGSASVVLGGERNLASATTSLAAGTRAKATNQGAFVWADASTNVDFASTRSNQFLIRAINGVGINTNNPGTNALLVNGRSRIQGDLEVTGQILGNVTITNAIFPTVTANTLVSTNNNPIAIQPGGTTGLLVGPEETEVLVFTNPFDSNIESYTGTAHNVIGGFSGNAANPGVVGATIGGGGQLIVSNSYGVSTNFNLVLDHFGTIGGGAGNTTDGLMSTVGGGSGNSALGNWATIGGGLGNVIEDPTNVSSYRLYISTIAGGEANAIIDAAGGTIGGGHNNLITSTVPILEFAPTPATIGGGYGNVSSNAPSSTIGGGFENTASEYGATVGGGMQNRAAGMHATVPGGENNEASGTASFAAGVNAKATNNYAFVWGGSPEVETTSAADHSFTVRSPGSARFLTTTATTDPLVGVVLTNGATSWSSLSDSNAKTAIHPVDYRGILNKLAALPVTAWSYKHDPQRRYIGPMAQDFHAAFGLGSDDKSISTLDTDGVTLAAIKGLIEEIDDQDRILSERDAQIGRLEESLRQVREQLRAPGGDTSF